MQALDDQNRILKHECRHVGHFEQALKELDDKSRHSSSSAKTFRDDT